MSSHATFHTRGGRSVTVSDATAPDYHSPGVVWCCDGCGERSDWPLTTGTDLIDPAALVTAAARGHAALCTR